MRPNTIAGPSGVAYRCEWRGVHFHLYEEGKVAPVAEGKLEPFPGGYINYWWIRRIVDDLWLRTDTNSPKVAAREAVYLVDGWRQNPARSRLAAQVRNISID